MDVLHRANLLTEGLQLGITGLEGHVADEDAAAEDGRVVDIDDGGGGGSGGSRVRHGGGGEEGRNGWIRKTLRPGHPRSRPNLWPF